MSVSHMTYLQYAAPARARPGMPRLGDVFGRGKPVLDGGLLPSLYGDLVKLGIAAIAPPPAWRMTVARGRRH